MDNRHYQVRAPRAYRSCEKGKGSLALISALAVAILVAVAIIGLSPGILARTLGKQIVACAASDWNQLDLLIKPAGLFRARIEWLIAQNPYIRFSCENMWLQVNPLTTLNSRTTCGHNAASDSPVNPTPASSAPGKRHSKDHHLQQYGGRFTTPACLVHSGITSASFESARLVLPNLMTQPLLLNGSYSLDEATGRAYYTAATPQDTDPLVLTGEIDSIANRHNLQLDGQFDNAQNWGTPAFLTDALQMLATPKSGNKEATVTATPPHYAITTGGLRLEMLLQWENCALRTLGGIAQANTLRIEQYHNNDISLATLPQQTAPPAGPLLECSYLVGGVSKSAGNPPYLNALISTLKLPNPDITLQDVELFLEFHHAQELKFYSTQPLKARALSIGGTQLQNLSLSLIVDGLDDVHCAELKANLGSGKLGSHAFRGSLVSGDISIPLEVTGIEKETLAALLGTDAVEQLDLAQNQATMLQLEIRQFEVVSVHPLAE